MIFLRADTANQEIHLGPFLDATNAVDEETALGPIAATSIKVFKAGASSLVNKNDTATATHDANGFYTTTVNATDTDEEGSGFIYCNLSGALPVKIPFTVLPGQVYDSIIAGTEDLEVKVASLAAAALTAINGEVDDVINTDATTEPGSVPAATASLGTKIDFLFALASNKITQTSTLQTLRNDGDTNSIGTASVSDDSTTFTRGPYT